MFHEAQTPKFHEDFLWIDSWISVRSIFIIIIIIIIIILILYNPTGFALSISVKNSAACFLIFINDTP